MRVWLKHEDTPGLAMSRSFGDSMACRAGVHAVPEVQTFDLNSDDKIIVIASDGVWEFLENE
jgi:serine/threonine protein phosphatase PrpC